MIADRAPGYTVVGVDSMFKVLMTDATGAPDESCRKGCRQESGCARSTTCPKNATDVAAADGERWERLLWPAMRERGILLTANQDESQFLSAAHTTDVIDETIDAYDTVLEEIA